MFIYFSVRLKAQAEMRAVRGMDSITPMLPATALISSMEKKEELINWWKERFNVEKYKMRVKLLPKD